jgi:putative flavoprotein involved in K+ transport
MTRARRAARNGAVDVVVIGAGHSGLAMSAFLSQHGVNHVVLERGQVANSWRRERWDSLRLLTPNWLSRLPGHRYDGDDPHGFMSLPEVITFIDDYARVIAAPVHTGVTVLSVTDENDGYRVCTDSRDWRCRCVVLANGAFGIANVPATAAAAAVVGAQPFAGGLPPATGSRGGRRAGGGRLGHRCAARRRDPALGATGHARGGRAHPAAARLRGRDIQGWLESLGILDQRIDEVDDVVRVRRVPSPQLVGSPEHATLDLNALTERGVRSWTASRLCATGGLSFRSLRSHCAMADLKQQRLLASIDRWVEDHPYRVDLRDAATVMPTWVPDQPRLALDFGRERVRTVLWATGFRPDYSWLHLPVLDAKRQLQHEGGIVSAPGVYALGLSFMRRRKSASCMARRTTSANSAMNCWRTSTRSTSVRTHHRSRPWERRCKVRSRRGDSREPICPLVRVFPDNN